MKECLKVVDTRRAEVVDQLVACLQDPEHTVRFSAAEALGRLGPAAARVDVVTRLVEWLQGPRGDTAEYALKQFGPMAAHSGVVGRLVELLRHPDVMVGGVPV
ncbi:MAG TPA: HEAT repeat domain-containing protein, partial [Bryobacteraceae bacterium]